MKYALITGANRGLGKGFVEYLADNRYFVFAGMRNIKDQANKNILPLVFDVSSDLSIKKAFETIKSKTDNLDLIVNNAGVNKDTATDNHKEFVCNLGSLKRENLLNMFDVNSISPLMILQEFLPLLKSDPCFVINISSCRASFHDEFENLTGNYGYRASKIALNMLTFCSVKDLQSNIKTFTVHPGGVKTDMNPEGDQMPYDQAEKIISITRNWKDEFNGKFMRWSGEYYPL